MPGVEGTQNNKPIPRKVVQKETMFSIARSYNISIHDLAAANGWVYKNGKMIDKSGKEVSLKIGMSIMVPDTTMAAKPKPQETPAPQSKPQVVKNSTHTVVSGDNPLAIANKYEVSIRQLADANGWELVTTTANGKEKLEVQKDGKPVVLQKGQSLEIPQSVTKNIGKVATLQDIQKKTGMSDGLLEVITKFEGDPKNNYKPYTKAYKDDIGTWTIGYGDTKGVNSKTTRSVAASYEKLAKDYLQTSEDLRLVLGDEVYNKMPQSLREGAIDLIYNKGFEALDVEAFKAAIQNDDIAGAMKSLIYTKSIKDNKEYNGLYKRSLARLAHVYNGLKGEKKIQAKSVVDEFYARTVGRVKVSELENWWQPGSQPEPVVQVEQKPVSQSGQKLPDGLSAEIIKIKEMDLNSAERLKKTEELFTRYAQKYNLSEEAVKIFKEVAKDEYDSWFWVDTDKMTAMTNVLDAQDAKSLHKAITGAIDKSSEARKFAAEVLTQKINKDNIREIIELSGGADNFVKMMKKVGGFDILKHSLASLIGDDNQELLVLFNKAAKDESYTEVRRIFNSVTATTPEQISKNLNKTLVDDDDLNSILYKYQIKQVTDENIIEVLRSNDIIAGICEADNDRAVCKEEIQKLFDVLNKNYELDPQKREEFLSTFNREFRERGINPSTWWIGTKEVSAKFRALLDGDIKPRNVKKEICNYLGFDPEINSLEKLTRNGKVVPLTETYEPSGTGELSGKRIVINAGHGGFNKNNNVFDKGAINSETGIDEWLVNRYMAQRVIEELTAKGAEVVLTAGHVETVSYKNNKADMTISLHCDSHSNEKSFIKIIANKGDKKDKALGEDILNQFVAGDNVLFKNKRDTKETIYDLEVQTNDAKRDSFIVKVEDDKNKMILRKDNRANSPEPSVLIEFCNIKREDEVRNVVFGNYGRDVINSIINGVVDYWDS